jgi:hypothetical protein
MMTSLSNKKVFLRSLFRDKNKTGSLTQNNFFLVFKTSLVSISQQKFELVFLFLFLFFCFCFLSLTGTTSSAASVVDDGWKRCSRLLKSGSLLQNVFGKFQKRFLDVHVRLGRSLQESGNNLYSVKSKSLIIFLIQM